MPRPSAVCPPAAARARLAASRLAGVELAPPDPILGISEAFRADTSPDKLNLGVGAYRTEELKPLVLSVVRKAEAAMLASGEDKEYLPIEGLAAFRKATADLLFGTGSAALQEASGLDWLVCGSAGGSAGRLRTSPPHILDCHDWWVGRPRAGHRQEGAARRGRGAGAGH